MELTYFILLMVGVSSGALVNVPANTAVKLGGQLRLNCSSTATPSTSFTWWNGTDPLYGCIPDATVVPPYHFDATKDKACDLIVDAATYDQAQVFTCDTGVVGEKASAAVAVLSADTTSLSYIGSNKATVGSEVTVQCSIEYASSMLASLMWTMDSVFDVINMTRSSMNGAPEKLNSNITVTQNVAGTNSLYCASYFSPVAMIITQPDLDKSNVTYGTSSIAVTFDSNGATRGTSVSALLFGIIGFLTLKSIRSSKV